MISSLLKSKVAQLAKSIDVYVILNHLKISRRFELAGKIWNRICELQDGSGRNLDDFSSDHTTKVLMSVSQD
jgi:hypothetical protein